MSAVVDVPCNGCTLCCRGDLIRIHPECGDDARKWETYATPVGEALKHKPNGDCWYLGPAGCLTWSDRPTVCGELDCRVIYQASRQPELRKSIEGSVSAAVLAKGKALLDV